MADEKGPPAQNMNLPHGLKLRIDDDTAQGSYSNMQVVGAERSPFGGGRRSNSPAVS